MNPRSADSTGRAPSGDGDGLTLSGEFDLARKTLARLTGLSALRFASRLTARAPALPARLAATRSGARAPAPLEPPLPAWEGGGQINEAGQRALAGVERLLLALAEVIRKEAIPGWLETPSDGFGGLKPVEVVERGEGDRLWRMIYFLGSGTSS